MVFESENGERLINPSRQEILSELKKLDGVRNSYAFLEDGECYIQVGGGPIEFTVEIRHAGVEGGFKHWKAEVNSTESKKEKNLIISGRVVIVNSNQILNGEQVKILFKAFMDGDKLSNIVQWVDITSMFD